MVQEKELEDLYRPKVMLEHWFESHPFSKEHRYITHFDGQQLINWLNFDREELIEMKQKCERIIFHSKYFMGPNLKSHSDDVEQVFSNLLKSINEIFDLIAILKSYNLEPRFTREKTLQKAKEILSGNTDDYDVEVKSWIAEV